jgi:hypothetical protein
LIRPIFRTALLESLAAAAVVLIIGQFLRQVGTTPAQGVLEIRPTPDAAELAWVAQAFAEGRGPLMPIADELHPSRFAPVHPLLASLWLRVWDGDLATALRGYSLAAMVLGAVLLHLWLGVAGLSPLGRVVVVAAVLRTPLAIAAARSLLQEPTLFLLFAAGGLAWSGGLRLLRDAPRRPVGVCVFGLAGAILAAFTCIRPTGAPLLVVAAVDAVWTLGRRPSLGALGALALGAALVLGADVIYTLRVAGIVHLVAYSHWHPHFWGFSWARPFEPTRDIFHQTQGLRLLRDALGLTGHLSSAGVASAIVALVGIDLLLRFRTAPMRTQAVLLAVFALSQATAHLFYEFYATRFFIAAYPAFLIAGVAGWEAALRSLWRGERWRRAAVVLAVPALTVLFLGIGRPWPIAGKLASEKEWRMTQAHRANGERVRALECPLFVDRLPVLNMRLLLGLGDWPHPIAPLVSSLDLYSDGHSPLFVIGHVAPGRGHIEDPPLWPGDPARSFLVDHRGQVANDGRIERLVAHDGRIAVYGPSWRTDAAGPLRIWAKAHGLSVHDLSRDPRVRLWVIEQQTGN